MMQVLSPTGHQVVNDLAQRYGFSPEAVTTLLDAVLHGQGSMAQFNHPEFGGSGQWMQGGMIMLSDLFNHALKNRVDGLCNELSTWVRNTPEGMYSGSFQSQTQGDSWQSSYNRNDGYSQQQHNGSVSLFIPPSDSGVSDWWGADLRWPTSTGAQNGVRYAYFAQACRLAIEVNGQVTIYDTLDHQIGGFSQQQGLGGSLTFSSQYGLIDLQRLPVITSGGETAPSWPPLSPIANEPLANGENNLFTLIERLADLHAKGILSTEEFSAKKAELLNRI